MSAFRLPRIESYFEQVRERLRVGQIVDRDDVDVVVHGRAHDVAADAAEPVDPDLDGHRASAVRAPPATGTSARAARCMAKPSDSSRTGLRGGQSAALEAWQGAVTFTRFQRCTRFTASSSSRSSSSCRPYLLYQAMRYRKYIGSLPQRMGYLPVSFNLDGDESIWIHAVSVGEVLTARALLPQLRERYPRLRLFLSTTTMTGQQVAREQPARTSTASSTFPFDLGFIVNRTLRLVKPRLFIMMETEIWPNLLRACRRDGVKTVLVNGRISSRSYPALPAGAAFFRRVLADVDRFCMQSEESARRIIEIGADRDAVVVTGSLKFDSLDCRPVGRAARRAPPPSVRRAQRGRPRAALLPHQRRRGRWSSPPARSRAKRSRSSRRSSAIRAALAERAAHHRAAQARALRRSRAAGAPRRLARGAPQRAARSTPSRAATSSSSTPSASWRSSFRSRPSVFVGGSLVDAGGHNILEPAVFGKPIVFGPHMQNFAEIARAFLENGAAVQVRAGARARDGAGRAARRSGAPRQPRRRGAGPGRSQSRRARQEPRGDRRAAAARRDGNVRPFGSS